MSTKSGHVSGGGRSHRSAAPPTVALRAVGVELDDGAAATPSVSGSTSSLGAVVPQWTTPTRGLGPCAIRSLAPEDRQRSGQRLAGYPKDRRRGSTSNRSHKPVVGVTGTAIIQNFDAMLWFQRHRGAVSINSTLSIASVRDPIIRLGSPCVSVQISPASIASHLRQSVDPRSSSASTRSTHLSLTLSRPRVRWQTWTSLLCW